MTSRAGVTRIVVCIALFVTVPGAVLAGCTPVPPPTAAEDEPTRQEPDAGSEPSHKRDKLDASAEDQPAGGHKAQAGEGGSGDRGGAGGNGGAGGKDSRKAKEQADASAGEHMPVDSGAADGGEKQAADAGGTSMADKKPRWSCRPVDNGGCLCTQSDVSEDSCAKPLPSCCFTSLKGDQPRCECWPADSQSCRDYRNEAQNPNLIGTCPPR